MSNYEPLFTNIIAKHLHSLVDIVGKRKSNRILLHQWILGIEESWTAYANTTQESEFIARLAFWIGGLREKFESSLTEEQAIELAIKAFDASTFCYFEYGAQQEIETQIKKYCTDIDNYFHKKVLSFKMKKFLLSQDAIPIINTQLSFLQRYGSKLTHAIIGINKDISTASALEKEFFRIFTIIAKEYVIAIKNNPKWAFMIQKHLYDFNTECMNMGYENVVSQISRLSIRVVNILGFPKKNIDITITQDSTKFNKQTDNEGYLTLDSLSQGKITITVIVSDKIKSENITLKKLYTKKTIRLFAL